MSSCWNSFLSLEKSASSQVCSSLASFSWLLSCLWSAVSSSLSLRSWRYVWFSLEQKKKKKKVKIVFDYPCISQGVYPRVCDPVGSRLDPPHQSFSSRSRPHSAAVVLCCSFSRVILICSSFRAFSRSSSLARCCNRLLYLKIPPNTHTWTQRIHVLYWQFVWLPLPFPHLSCSVRCSSSSVRWAFFKQPCFPIRVSYSMACRSCRAASRSWSRNSCSCMPRSSSRSLMALSRSLSIPDCCCCSWAFWAMREALCEFRVDFSTWRRKGSQLIRN